MIADRGLFGPQEDSIEEGATNFPSPRLVHMNPTSRADARPEALTSGHLTCSALIRPRCFPARPGDAQSLPFGAADRAYTSQVSMGPKPTRSVVAPPLAGPDEGGATATVTALYQANALSMVRLAHVMLGDRGAAEDIVQEAFSGLYRRWAHLSDHDKALSYVRSSVLNACRSALRRLRPELIVEPPGQARSGESAVLDEEERVAVMAALRQLPHRQREVLVLRFYLDMTDHEIAAAMGIGASTVRSAAHRALATLGRILGEST